MIPASTFTTEDRGEASPCTALKIFSESISNSTSLIPTSLAKLTPTSKAFSSASTTPREQFYFLLKATTTSPASSLMITPAPARFLCEKTAPSVLTL